MTLASQVAVMTVPLAAYFGALGVLHSGPRPRLVSGPVDVVMLAGGLGGLLTFGPVGQVVVGRFLGGSNPVAWTTWCSIVALMIVLWLASASRRVIVYNVLPDDLRRAARDAFESLQGEANPTIDGFEDESRSRGIAIRSSRLLRTGTIESRGLDPEALIAALTPRLRSALGDSGGNPSGMALAMFGVAALMMLLAPAIQLAARYSK